MLGKSRLFLPVMHQYKKETSFYYAEGWFSVVGINVCKKLTSNWSKNSSQILILCKNRLWKAVLYKSNFVKKITKCNQKYFRWSFVFRLNYIVFLQDIVHLHIAIHSHIFWTYNDKKFIVESLPHSHIHRYFCHKHDTHERWQFSCRNT